MSAEERSSWDERYASGDYQPRLEPSPFLETALGVVPPGRALVLACGTGRNAIRLAEAGFDVHAIDISSVAIDRAREEATARDLDVHWEVADLDGYVLTAGTYDLVTMVRYVDRDVWPMAVTALTPDGWLLVEEHLKTHRVGVVGPGDDYRVDAGELLRAFSNLRIVQYGEGLESDDRTGAATALARLLACRGDPGW